MVSINSGTGNGEFGAGVNSDNRLEVDSVSRSHEHFANQEKGTAYSAVIQQTPTGASDVFLFIKNNDERDMVFEGITVAAATDESILVKLGDTGTTTGGTALTPANLNGGSGNVADGTFETGNDITGLTGGITVHRILVDGGTGSEHFRFTQDLILPKNKTLTLTAESGSILLDCVLAFNFS